ncbi:MAG TPA: SBBP repeat-containing protein [Verrucomicrobiae bacterium]|nr:SBBP repeat-containing protein [Verrucomicrobiae bacterium]
MKTFFGAGIAAVTAAGALSAQAVNLGNLPLWFEAGPVQTDGSTHFIAHGRDAEFSITPSGAEFTLHRTDGHQATAHMTFVGAGASPLLAGDTALGGKINYLLGNNPSQWQTGVSTFAKVRLDQVYPGVNVVYYGNQQHLEYDFNLAAGVNPQTIAIRFDGAESISVNAAGELVIQLDGGQIIQRAPLAYQTISGGYQPVTAGYKILDAHTVTFAVADFNHTQPLVIDPVLGYSTFFGGNFGDKAWAIAISSYDSSIYIAGQTFSTQISNGVPFTKNAISNGSFTNFSGGAILGDAFVAKLDQTGTNLLYCTYLGGTGDNAAYAIAVDSLGSAYVTGITDATNFPVKNSLSYTNFQGTNIHGVYNTTYKVYPSDVFVTKLATNGASLAYSTYLGGSSWDYAYGIAVDENHNAYVTGSTLSSNFPVTMNTAIQTNLNCTNNFYLNFNAFVAKIDSTGNNLIYSTYLGGTNQDVGNAIAYANGRVFVAGSTTSTNFLRVAGLPGMKFLNGSSNTLAASDDFVTAFTNSTTGLGVEYSTFLGGSNNDIATGIAADSDGNAYVVGWTTSTNFPNSPTGAVLNSYVLTNSSGFIAATNAFLTKITWDGVKAASAFSRVFGDFGIDVANGVALDSARNVFIVGSASSTNFPVTRANIFGSLKSTNTGLSDVFVTAFKADFSSLLYSTYVGGSQDDLGLGISVDTNGDAWVTGTTSSTNFPVFGSWHAGGQGVRHPTMVGTNDVFLTKITTTGAPTLGASHAGTNILVFWSPVSDVTSTNQLLETTANLIMKHVYTNITATTTNLATNAIATTNWVVLTNPVPVLTNGNYIYTFVPTNPAQFFRFHH